MAQRQQGYAPGDIAAASSGIEGFHVGEAADPRSVEAASKRGYDMSDLRAQRFEVEDFDQYDLIVAMDEGHYSVLLSLAKDMHQREKIRLFADYCGSYEALRSVPDPYYGGDDGFRRVIDIVEDGCDGILRSVRAASKA
jgi:protein-tyrosine phosphatase